jgi:hypothetical protein
MEVLTGLAWTRTVVLPLAMRDLMEGNRHAGRVLVLRV